MFNFIRADLTAYKPCPPESLKYGEVSAEGFGEPPSSDPRFPKSLYLMKPLFFAYELNAVALTAQASVPIPEGLDLDAWIVPFSEELVSTQEAAADEPFEGKKIKKGKKDSGKTKRKGKTRAREHDGDEEDGDYAQLAPVVGAPVETAEERAERERVSVRLYFHTNVGVAVCITLTPTCGCVPPRQNLQRKAERMERLRDDPYYLVDDRPPPTRLSAPDVDAIPVVRLDDLPLLAQGM